MQLKIYQENAKWPTYFYISKKSYPTACGRVIYFDRKGGANNCPQNLQYLDWSQLLNEARTFFERKMLD